MKNILTGLILVICLPVHGQRNILSDTSKVAILKADDPHTFSLSQQDSAAIEKVFNDALDREFGKQSNFGSKKGRGIDNKQYYIQLVPRLNGRGEKEVWVNCFCLATTPSFNWLKEIFNRQFIMDGGSCFFELVIDIRTRNYHDFGMNGFA